VAGDPVPHAQAQVQAGGAGDVAALGRRLEDVDDAQRVLVVPEAAAEARVEAGVEDRLADVPERRVAEVVAQADRLDEVLVERKRAGDRAGDLRHLERVRHPRAVVVALGRDEDLRLVLQAPERLAVHDPVAVALQRGAQRAVLLGDGALGGVGGRRERRELLLLPGAPAVGEALRDGARCGGCVHGPDSRSRGPRHGRRLLVAR
jgi:hypothetical protein